MVQALSLQGEGRIILGSNCSLGVYPSPNFFHGECYLEAREPDSRLEIGNGVLINNNAKIIVDRSNICIGDNTLIGPNFTCFDSNFHPLDPNIRLSGKYRCKSVHIGKNVFIGANVTILQGVTIGDNSVIGAGVVLRESIPANHIASVSGGLTLVPIKLNAFEQ